MNIAWYYMYLRRFHIGKTLHFSRLPRTILLFGLYTFGCKKLYAAPECQKNYRININNLLDRDSRYLYENPSFLSLVRRIHSRYNHLINPAFDIDPEILLQNKELDRKYQELDKMEQR
jgi:hypothetical protein